MNWWKYSRQFIQMHKYISLIRDCGIINAYLCRLEHAQLSQLRVKVVSKHYIELFSLWFRYPQMLFFFVYSYSHSKFIYSKSHRTIHIKCHNNDEIWSEVTYTRNVKIIDTRNNVFFCVHETGYLFVAGIQSIQKQKS